MKKIFVDKIKDDIVLTDNDHRHLSLVLRAKIGDELILCDGDGYDYKYKITSIDYKSTKLKLIGKTSVDTEPKTVVDLYVALLKSDKLEWVCQKCTELGVSGIYPFLSEYVQVKKESFKADRLDKICKEAVQQSGRGKLPKIGSPIDFSELSAKLNGYDNVLFLYEKGETPIKEQIKNLSGSTAIVIGSEGGFSDKEAETLISDGITPISLGKRILRAETACVAAVAIVMYELKELQ